MEHVRSTLATTAVAVCGLFVAAHVLHPGNFEDLPRPAQRADVVASVPAPTSAPAPVVSWTDPPANLRGTATPATAMVADASPPLPSFAVALPQDATVTPLPRETTAPAAKSRKIVRAPRAGAARPVSRTRRSAPIRVAAVVAPLAPVIPRTERPADARANPISGLLHGLGFDPGS